MVGELLLVGSIPLDTAEEVFRRVGGPLGPYLAYMPDGEVGDRRYWIDGIAYRVFNGHPEIETLRRPAPDASGIESWRPFFAPLERLRAPDAKVYLGAIHHMHDADGLRRQLRSARHPRRGRRLHALARR